MSDSSSSTASPSINDANYQGIVKDVSRQSRLSFRNFAEHQLRQEFKNDAIEKCQLQVKAFAECGKEEGLMVIFRCQDFYKEVTDCMAYHNSNQRWEIYKKEHEADLQSRIIGTK